MRYKSFLRINKGFVLLFAVTLSSIFLAIALGVTNIAYKELKFSTNARATNDAFFAADTGVECALANDKSSSNIFNSSSSASSINCVNISIPIARSGTSPILFWDFVLPGLGSGGKACAKVKVAKDFSNFRTTVISKGYDLGGDTADCASSNLNRVEREIKVDY